MSARPAVQEPNAAGVERMQAAVAELKHTLAAYAREHGGRFVLFGSAARREMRPDSDVDIFVDFPDGAQNEAASFAEDASWGLGIRPDILGYGALVGRFGERVEREGLVLPGDEHRWSEPMSNEDRWGDVLDHARSAAAHFRAAEEIFGEGGFEEAGPGGYRTRMAFYHSMQSAQTSLESALKRALVALGKNPATTGGGWHKALLAAASGEVGPRGQQLLTPELAAAAKETLEFRHFASHAYDRPFIPEKARPAVEAGRLLADRIEAALAAFAEQIKPD